MRTEKQQGLHSRKLIFQKFPGIAEAEKLFDALDDVLFCVKNRSLQYIGGNDAFIRSAGVRSRSELLGKSAFDLFPKELAACYEQQDEEMLSRGKPLNDRLEMVTRRDGEIGWFVSQKTLISDSDGTFLAICGISRDLSLVASGPREEKLDAIAESISLLHENYAEPLRVMELAHKAGLSASQFARRVRTMTGLTPRQLLTKARVEAAAVALRDTNLPLGVIATNCGFYDQASLTRHFKAATGSTPAQYRNAFRAAGNT
ncbi:AraC family transcriptional regulator [Blastopirellula marina]|uniref:AraC family transcriptional regulator n=1 Tax=Blastopirellula marina TaxID=124 RepID=A0A2S8GBN7_9BACT|nr:MULTISPECIES: AraC family transcriptional regulator [Pirellulaceae]PQO41843.1 AraC family transcriptional regulator [Blastopirellula marina]RCS56395.1 AraC family transcriptional regulator [Bremerella cremea]